MLPSGISSSLAPKVRDQDPNLPWNSCATWPTLRPFNQEEPQTWLWHLTGAQQGSDVFPDLKMFSRGNHEINIKWSWSCEHQTLLTAEFWNQLNCLVEKNKVSSFCFVVLEVQEGLENRDFQSSQLRVSVDSCTWRWCHLAWIKKPPFSRMAVPILWVGKGLPNVPQHSCSTTHGKKLLSNNVRPCPLCSSNVHFGPQIEILCMNTPWKTRHNRIIWDTYEILQTCRLSYHSLGYSE